MLSTCWLTFVDRSLGGLPKISLDSEKASESSALLCAECSSSDNVDNFDARASSSSCFCTLIRLSIALIGFEDDLLRLLVIDSRPCPPLFLKSLKDIQAQVEVDQFFKVLTIWSVEVKAHIDLSPTDCCSIRDCVAATDNCPMFSVGIA